ncbi:hypothetical protein [Paraburkholderia elongata]|uniref:Transmembrane protein n=1 Tax=Paraburkholderia elongata TaxID=2675747 RepID=A0A972SJT7_9BURK|nr:hypothetical protein [Paraburkholderia elongata]NPT56050.1 hypothetical protein [Paraburkholderia elongata]
MNDQIKWTTLITVYSAGVAACYLAGFWGQFDINIFQFAGLTGFASMALYPLMTAIGLNLLASLVVRSKQSVEREGTRESAWRRLYRKVYVAWLSVAPLGTLVVISLIADPVKWVLVLFVMTPWISWLAELPLVVKAIPGQSRSTAVYWLVAFPILATQLGASHAQAYFEGTETRTVAPTGAAKDLQWDPQHPIGYLGFTGGTYFLFESKTGNVVMVNQAVAAPLTLQRRSLPTTAEWLRGIFQHKR